MKKMFLLITAFLLSSFSFLAAQSIFTSSRISAGTPVKIVGISSEDAYYNSREDFMDKKGEATEELSRQEGEYYSGNVRTDDGKEYYFYKVKLASTGKNTQTSTSSGGTMTKGTRIKIVDLSKNDAYYDDYDEIVGKTGTFNSESEDPDEKGWYSGSIVCDDGEDYYFFEVKLVRTGGTSNTTKSSTTTKSSSSSSAAAPSSSGSTRTYTEDVPVVRRSGTTLYEGTRIRITEVSSEDAYYEDRKEIVGKTGVINEDSEQKEGGWHAGSISTDDGESYYFYKVRLSVEDEGIEVAPKVKVDATPLTKLPIAIGTKVVIMDIHKDDSHYSDYQSIVGKSGTITEEMGGDGKGWFSGPVKTDDGKEYYFFKVALGKKK